MKTARKLTLIGLSVLLSCLALGQTSLARVDDFYFESMEIDYYLSKDEANRSTLKVKEVLKPVFPDIDQNRGIIRSIPTEYQDHSLNLEIGAILRNGEPANIYKSEVVNKLRMLTIRDQSYSSYLHGLNTFEINYQMQDVTQKPNDASIDEFYWDTNGTGWNQEFKQVTARVHLDESIRDAVLIDNLACMTGAQGSTDRNCQFERAEDNSLITFSTTQALSRLENMTIAIGFESDTFAKYAPATWKIILAWFAGITILTSLVSLITAIFKRKSAFASQVPKSYPAEYLPPKDFDVFSSSVLYNNFPYSNRKMLACGLLDLAVRHKLKIKDKLLSFDIELEKSDLSKNEERFFRAVFAEDPVLGKDYSVSKVSTDLAKRLQDFNRDISLDIRVSYYYDRTGRDEIVKENQRLSIIAMISSLASFIILMIAVHEVGQAGMPFFLSSNGWFSLLMLSMMANMPLAINNLVKMGDFHKLSDKGLTVKTHLFGLKKYIAMAEKERLAFNQSVKGASRDSKDRVVLYERILPYAVIFGLENSWAEVLKTAYNESSVEPDWFVGDAMAISALTSSIVSTAQMVTYSAESTSSSLSSNSSSSGSSGGGYSGGGGGGGGGGGC